MKYIIAIVMTMMASRAFAQLGELDCPLDEDANSTLTLLPNPYNCSTYYACAQGAPVLFVCPEGLVFNAEEQVCDYKYRANCVEVELTTVAPPTTNTPASSYEGPPASEPEASDASLVADADVKVEADKVVETKVATETVPVTKLVTVAVPVTEVVTQVVPVTDKAVDVAANAEIEVTNDDKVAALGDADYLTA